MLPDSSYIAELRRPWKLFSFAGGMAWLLYGALNYGISDWDVGISLLMGGLTYLCAPWSIRVILHCVRFRPKYWLLWIGSSLAVALFVIDGVYYLYHTIVGNQMLRRENLYASSALYFLAGCIWLYRGSLRDFVDDYRALPILQSPLLEKVKKLLGAIIGAGAMLLLALPKYSGVSMMGFLFFLVPLHFYSIYRMTWKKEERKLRLTRMAIWLACIILVAGTHYYMHIQTRNAADKVLNEVLVYRGKQNTYPMDLNALSSNAKEIAKINRIAYFINDKQVYLFYPATFNGFNTYFYDFEANTWRFRTD